ncbi:MAG TPA: CBS domain-containing protein, partial [Kofleriaceae bacterium]|nr:CBS domain-containing protein [Kofleriaceae bacterium]
MTTNTRSHKELDGELDAERRREFMHAILTDVRALERMITEGRFETGIRRIGAEQEMFLIDQQWVPARGALKMLELLRDDHFTTELGLFQLEANCDPQVFTGDGLSRMHAQLDDLVGRARAAASAADMDVVLMGILPTMRKSDLALDSMVPSPRYMTLNRIMTELRGGNFEFSIKGLDELIIEHDSVMLEACNSSFQVHLQVTPAEFARVYNLAQVLAGPIMAISANSPLLFGRRLWAETRIALFRQAVDTRLTHHLRETEARVSFGTRWVKESVVEIFKEDIARFRTLVSTDLDENPMEKLDRGEAPLLKALRLHNGTIYRWNRPCYGLIDGKPHLRIENRVMPAGPSTIDEISNGAFWFGLMTELAHRGEEVHRRIDFDQAGANFYTAAREGLGATFGWLDGEDISARNLVLDRLLPLAEAGLRRAAITDGDVKRYLGVIDHRVRTARTGARWQFSSWNSLRDRATPGERANALVAATVKRQLTGRPVSEWERARLDEADVTRHNYLRVEQYMTTDLFTVQSDDPIEMIANLMIWERIRHVPVEDKDHRLIGLVTQRAVLRFIASHGISHRTPASAIMRRDVLTVAPETPTIDAIRLMRRKRIGCLPVVQDGRLVGILTEEDFLTIASKLLEERLGDGTVEAIEGPGTGRTSSLAATDRAADRSASHRLPIDTAPSLPPTPVVDAPAPAPVAVAGAPAPEAHGAPPPPDAIPPA